MPLHDWSRVPSGVFHHFHQDWSVEIARALNRGLLPKGMSALVEQRAGPREADVLTIESFGRGRHPEERSGGLVVLDPPRTSVVRKSEIETYADLANRIVIRHRLGRVVALIEIVSPGNKDSRASLRDFVEKAIEYMQKGIHLLVIDLFPPTPRDPAGIHKAIWDEFVEEEFSLPPGKNRVLVSYEIAAERTAYIEPVGVGDALPAMPLFLAAGVHLKTPLEATYQSTWEATPLDMRRAVETGIMPDPEGDDSAG